MFLIVWVCVIVFFDDSDRMCFFRDLLGSGVIL